MLRPAIHNYGGFVDVVSVDSASGIAVVKFKGPAPIGMGIQAAIKDKFPDVKDVVLVDENRLVQV
jgi:Fe-S cluster biogenesis protein NfuA